METDKASKHVVCLEFFSGIGGLHYGLQASGVQGTVAMSFDMNENANCVYEHNFGMRPNNKAIDYLEPADIDRYKATCWLLSPPCQPYTRGGKYLDDQDPRARGLIRLIKLLPELKHKPTHILLENVMNFENSQSRSILVRALGSMGFAINECLLSPLQFGIPNNRVRYYLVASMRHGARIGSGASEHNSYVDDYLQSKRNVIHTEWPFGSAAISLSLSKQTAPMQPQPLERYIDRSLDNEPSLLVPASSIIKRTKLEFDIVQPSSKQTSTFTKAYGSKHLIGSGSLLQTKNLDTRENGFGAPEKLLELGLRFFSPKEVALLHHFPLVSTLDDRPFVLDFPADITQRQRLQLLGNSLNVHVVAELIRHVLFAQQEPQGESQ
ncbi:hypothetical protein LPJ72_003199 [Coemansia sp. Benny D160-2]|nr:hypothetical protein LPJ72_003199 [Coemansia sp. Benny D160-2]